MKLTFLDTLVKRILFSLALSAVIICMLSLINGIVFISLYSILLIAVLVYIPLTLFYAIVSTFFTGDKDKSDDQILDR